MKRSIDDRTLLTYLLPYLSMEDLKDTCRDFSIKGFSRLKKSELIEFILDSISEEEMKDLLNKKELEIVSDGIQVALKKINGIDRERIDNISIVNPKEHEIEITFKGMNWEVKSYLSITPENITNPERDCDCRIGSNMGLCNHFWVGFIYSFKQGWFKLEDWSLTSLPPDIKRNLKTIEILKVPKKDKKESVLLADESSEDFQLIKYNNSSITIYEGEVTEIEQKTQEYQGATTIYYIIRLKNSRFGPKLQRKSDFREEDIVNIDQLNIRISEKLYEEHELKPGDKVGGNGKLTKDDFLKMYIVKNIKKIEKI